MKRDMDLCRQILLEIEARKSGESIEMLQTGASGNDVIEHLQLLQDAGLIAARVDRHSRDYSIQRLTWEGHEFLQAARDDGVWAEAKERIGSAWRSVTFSLLKEVLEHGVRNALNL